MFYLICLALRLHPRHLTPPDRPGTRVLCCPSIRLGNPKTHRPDHQGLEKTCSCWRELPLEAWSTLVVATEYSAFCVFDFASFVYLHVSLLESVCRAFVHLRPKCCLIVEVVCVCVFWHCSVFAHAFLLSTGHQALILVVPLFLGKQNDDIWFWTRNTSLFLMIWWTLQLSGEMLPPKSWNCLKRSALGHNLNGHMKKLATQEL